MILHCNLCGGYHGPESICPDCRADIMAAFLETWNIAYTRLENEHKSRLIEIHEDHIGPIDAPEDTPQTCLTCVHNKESCEEYKDGRLILETVQCDLNGEIYYPATRQYENVKPTGCGWEAKP